MVACRVVEQGRCVCEIPPFAHTCTETRLHGNAWSWRDELLHSLTI